MDRDDRLQEVSSVEKLVQRINELARKAKTTGLTDQELEERDRLRKQYLEMFRQAFRHQLESIIVEDRTPRQSRQ